MTTRTTSRKIAFRRPFLLRGFDSEQPAGAYIIDTEEELLESLSFPVWRRIATTIRLGPNRATEYLRIDPAELDDAWANDAAQSADDQQGSPP